MKTILGWWQVVAKHGREWSGWAGLGWAGLEHGGLKFYVSSPPILVCGLGRGGGQEPPLIRIIVSHFVFRL